MSKKRLSRTVIEGGRAGRNKWERHYSHSEQRAAERVYCTEVTKDPDCADDWGIEGKTKVYKEFTDKLGPMYRWLHKQVGRAWNDVYSEIKNTFDDRTTAGRHIIYDHLKYSVKLPEDPSKYTRYGSYEDDETSYYKNRFYVDEDGILKVKRKVQRKKYHYYNGQPLADWLAGRCVGVVGDKYYWFNPVGQNRKNLGYRAKWACTFGSSRYSGYGLTFHYLDCTAIAKVDPEDNDKIIYENQFSWREIIGSPTFRQGNALSEKDLKFWLNIPEEYRNKVLEKSPVYKG